MATVVQSLARAVPGSEFKRLLFLSSSPPAGTTGAQIIVRQLLASYDQSRLDVLCCDKDHAVALRTAPATLLPCPHTFYPDYYFAELRPKRLFGPLLRTLNYLRIYSILRRGRRLIQEKGIEAIFTASSFVEVNLAAARLCEEFNLPLYWFETDEWEDSNPSFFTRRLARRRQRGLFRSLAKLWLTSPRMVAEYRQRFGVEGDFLFHFVDVARYQAAARQVRPAAAPAPISLVYAGAINLMFLQAMTAISRFLNEGLTIDGRPVHLTIYGPACSPTLLGPGVSYGGFVQTDDIPRVLAQAHMLLVAVSFADDPRINRLVRTSLYTKTVDYLASCRPVLVVTPPYTAEADYFRDVTHLVTSLDREALVAGIRKLVEDHAYTQRLAQEGLRLIEQEHSPQALERKFLHCFRHGGQ